jgi:hypothetical protein
MPGVTRRLRLTQEAARMILTLATKREKDVIAEGSRRRGS